MSAEPPAAVQQVSRRGRRWRPGVVVAVIVALLAAAGLLLWQRDSAAPNPGDRVPVDLAPVNVEHAVPVPFVSDRQLRSLPAATTDTTIGTAPRDRRRGDATSGAVVHNLQQVPVFAAPGGEPFARLPVEQLGADTWLPVIADQPGWVQVLLPSRPNGSAGWLDTGRLAVARSGHQIRIDLRTARLQVLRDGETVGTWPVTIGATGTPTPAGRTFLLAVIHDPKQAFSSQIFALGSHSNTLDSYAGGPGTVGIHTWPTNDGRRASHGCIRVPHGAMTALAQVPLGSIVSINQ